MTTSEKERLEKQLREKGYQQSNYDANRWLKNGSSINMDSKNGFNDGGSNYRGYGICKDHLDKQK